MFHKPPIFYVKKRYVNLLRIIFTVIGFYFLYDGYYMLSNDIPYIRKGVIHSSNESPLMYYLHVLQQLVIMLVSFTLVWSVRNIDEKHKDEQQEKNE